MFLGQIFNQKKDAFFSYLAFPALVFNMRKRCYTLLEGPKPSLDGVPLPVVHNLVCCSMIQSQRKHLDLDLIKTLLPFSFYDKKKFAAITIRLSNPECTALLFSSGKLVVTGGRCW